jgi:Glycosyl hydrolases family 38 N-terminal domain/Glycosyl hydrolases family 38 C-terminal domain/Alpha mannosidase middle domain
MLVSQTLATSCEYLKQNPRAKFSFSDIAFLKLWIDSTLGAKECIKTLVAAGQFELLNGGFTQHDNASPYFDDILNNYEYAREFIKREFGVLPRTGWIIDPFGHSITTTRLFSEMGYLELVTNRIAEADRELFRNSAMMQQYWDIRGKQNYRLWFMVLPDQYQAPKALDTDFALGTPYKDFPNSNILDQGFDFGQRSLEFFDRIQTFSSWYATKKVLIPYGGDFWFSNFTRTYETLETMVMCWKSNSGSGRYAGLFSIEVSGLEQYFSELFEEASSSSLTFANKTGDFFPYQNSASLEDPYHQSWTGYFTTSPYSKRIFRVFGESVRALKHLLTLWVLRRGNIQSFSVNQVVSNSEQMMFQIGASLHHDTITGTSRKSVAKEYIEETFRLWRLLNTTYNIFLTQYIEGTRDNGTTFSRLVWPYGENLEINTADNYLFISTGGHPNKIIRILSSWPTLVFSEAKNPMPSAIVNDSESLSGHFTPATSNMFYNGTWEHVLYLYLNQGEGRVFQVAGSLVETANTLVFRDHNLHKLTIKQQELSFQVADGLLRLQHGKVVFQISLVKYNTSILSNYSKGAQGKYIFTSSGPPQTLLPSVEFSCTLQEWSGSLDISLSYEQSMIELNLKVLLDAPLTHRYSVRLISDVLDVTRTAGDCNYAVRYHTRIESNLEFYTDSNGLEKLKRKYGQHSLVADLNYYPLSRFIYLEDAEHRISVMVDRSCGGTSPAPGILEIMIFRRIDTDDGKGASEGAFEDKAVNILHYLIMEDLKPDQQLYRLHQVDHDFQVVIFGTHLSYFKYPTITEYAKQKFEMLDAHRFLKVLFDRRQDGRMMLRLYNLNDQQTIQIDINELLKSWGIRGSVKIEETSIDFNSPKSELISWKYTWVERDYPIFYQWQNILSLDPLEIRAFDVQLL